MAYRDVDMKGSVGFFATRLQIPSFTKGKPQLTALVIETQRSLAILRILTDRVIDTIRRSTQFLDTVFLRSIV